MVSLSYGSIRDGISRRIFEKSPGQHRYMRGLNHETMERGQNSAFELYGFLLPDVFYMGVSVLVSFLLLWTVSWFAGSLIALTIAIHILWSLYLNVKASEICGPVDEELRRANRYTGERWRYAEKVIASVKEEEECSFMEKWFRKVVGEDRSFWVWHAAETSRREFVGLVVLVVILSYGSHMVYSGSWESVGMLYPIFSWSSRILDQLWQIGERERRMSWCIVRVKGIMETLTVPPDVTNKPSAICLNSNGPVHLEFDDVWYSYPKSVPIIKGVSFEVLPGEKMALVGPSGHGKSTIEYLAMRFSDPERGAIRVNGFDLRDVKRETWLEAVSFIPQKAAIFDGTVRYNLVYPLRRDERERVTDEELRFILEKLNIDFGHRPEDEDPLEIMVGRDGIQLSGGQAQRLAIGSAILKKPRFMLIDEATSSLDSSTEKKVLAGLREFLGSTSVLVIAHRLSTVKDADRILVLSHGEIEATGRDFGEVYETSPTFRRMADDQNLAIE